MSTLSIELLQAHRAATFRTQPGRRITSPPEAVQFVNERGFIFFWPIKDILLPSLWTAAAGDRPVPNEHDDPGHVTWGWKDSLLGKGHWYYARTLRRRNTMTALNSLPYFYALSPNSGDPENDYLEQYERGLLTQEARAIYEALLKSGPLDTLEIRRQAHLSSAASQTAFNRALDDLMMQFKILPVGISQAGAWHYAFIYDLTPRHLPDLIERAGAITEKAARQHILAAYFRSVGAARASDAARLFGWRPADVENSLHTLCEQGQLVGGLEMPGQRGAWFALPALAE
jgi:hypothetical protein